MKTDRILTKNDKPSITKISKTMRFFTKLQNISIYNFGSKNTKYFEIQKLFLNRQARKNFFWTAKSENPFLDCQTHKKTLWKKYLFHFTRAKLVIQSKTSTFFILTKIHVTPQEPKIVIQSKTSNFLIQTNIPATPHLTWIFILLHTWHEYPSYSTRARPPLRGAPLACPSIYTEFATLIEKFPTKL